VQPGGPPRRERPAPTTSISAPATTTNTPHAAYTDLSFFTCKRPYHPRGGQPVQLPDRIQRYPVFTHLLVAPYNLHPRIQELIGREADHARRRASQRRHSSVKMNNLVDGETIDISSRLTGRRAHRFDGRGTCCLVPASGSEASISGCAARRPLSSNTPVLLFENHGGDALVLAGSADWNAAAISSAASRSCSDRGSGASQARGRRAVPDGVPGQRKIARSSTSTAPTCPCRVPRRTLFLRARLLMRRRRSGRVRLNKSCPHSCKPAFTGCCAPHVLLIDSAWPASRSDCGTVAASVSECFR